MSSAGNSPALFPASPASSLAGVPSLGAEHADGHASEHRGPQPSIDATLLAFVSAVRAAVCVGGSGTEPQPLHELSELADGVILWEVLHALDADHFSPEAAGVGATALHSTANLQKLTSALQRFFTALDVFGRPADLSFLDVSTVAKTGDRVPLVKLLELTLTAAVNCAHRELAVGEIMKLDGQTQHQLMFVIEDVMARHAHAHAGTQHRLSLDGGAGAFVTWPHTPHSPQHRGGLHSGLHSGLQIGRTLSLESPYPHFPHQSAADGALRAELAHAKETLADLQAKVRTHVYTHAHTHAHTHTHVHTHVHAHTCTHVHTHVHTRTHMHTRTHTCTHTDTHACTHTDTHTCTHTHTHTDTHTYVRRHTHTRTYVDTHTHPTYFITAKTCRNPVHARACWRAHPRRQCLPCVLITAHRSCVCVCVCV